MFRIHKLSLIPAAEGRARSLVQILAASAGLSALILVGLWARAPRVQAEEENEHQQDKARIKIGFSIAPVPLNLKGKDKDLVGLGSYIVNAVSGCNGCHSHGTQTEFTPTGNPYMLRPPRGPFSGTKQINPDTYLGGGRDFGPYPGLEHLYSRNLTPDKTGKPEGGRSFHEFLTIMRTGKDYDHLHPTCTGAPNGACVPPPFNGNLLQVMPWTAYQDMTERDIRAIYEYLSAVPCLDTVVAGAPYLRNDCH